ncbi:MAG: NUDIX domain-containing protein [Bacillota bacterium]|nr:NUDIX domain-containing protein [Bacillota bacterium]
MIKLRVMSAAYLMNDDDFLMMERSRNKKFVPGIWAGVGGHLGPEEINDPQRGCLREIYEETGIEEKEIRDLDLKYIILRRSKEEIRIQYIYIGQALRRDVSKTDEGELFWINKDQILERELSVTTRMTFKHYLKHGKEMKDVLVGVVSAENNNPVINWIPVQDWEGI